MISVVIPTLGRSPHLRGLLETLRRQKLIDFEVHVVANLPSQPLRQLVTSMGFEYHETGRLGVNFARNKGLDKARGDIVLFLDDDAILPSDRFLSLHAEAHKTHPHWAAIGGRYALLGSPNDWDLVYHKIAHSWLERARLDGDETTQLLGGNLSLKVDKLRSLGERFDEEITFGGAETGLCQRLILRGEKLGLLQSLTMGHSPDMNRGSFVRKAYWQGGGARWRSDHKSELPIRHSRWFTVPFPEFQKQCLAARDLDRKSYDFGFDSNPFLNSRPEPLPFSQMRFLKWQILRFVADATREFRAKIRDLYVTLMSASLDFDKHRK